MPLKPEVQEFLRLAEEAGLPPLHTLTPEQARAQAAQNRAMLGDGAPVDTVRDLTLSGRDGPIPARLYEPRDPAATIVWFHGGGWVIGDLDSHDPMCRSLANAAGCTLISVDYRLAPEHRFPAPLNDCWDALRAVAAERPGTPLIVGGDSAGANLAAVCALRARDAGGPSLALQLLVYPVTDHAMDTASYGEHGNGDKLLSREEMEWFFDHYVPDRAARDDPEVSPLRAPDLSNLPPAILVVAECDPLRDEGRAYGERLQRAGVTVTALEYEGVIHAFFSFGNVMPTGNEAVEEVGRLIRAAVAG